MHKAPNQDSQRSNRRNYLSSCGISILTPKVLCILIAVLGAACTFAIASVPHQLPKLATSNKTAVKPFIVQPTAPAPTTKLPKPRNQQVKKKLGIFSGLRSPAASSLNSTNAPLTFNKLHSQKRQQPLNSQSKRVTDFGKQQQTALKLAPEQQINPTPSPSVAVSSPTSSKLNTARLTSPPTPLLVGEGSLTLPFPSREGRSSYEELGGLGLLYPTSIASKLTLLSPVAPKPVQALPNHSTPAVAQVMSQPQLQERQEANQVSETKLKQNQPTLEQKAREVKLTLSDVVILALENNRPIKNAYLERIAQREELAVAESKFSPNFTPSVSISLAQIGSNRATTNGDVGLEATVRVPTGGQLIFRWAANGQTPNSNGSDPIDNGFGQNLRLSFNQPLLRGAGVNVNKASIDIARLSEQINILDLKSTLSNTITDAIVAYRDLLRTQERLKIAQLSLKSAQDLLEVSRALIEAGRLAPVDIVQSETDVANRQVNLVDAENSFDAARLALLNILDIDQNVAIVPAEVPTASPVFFDSNQLMQLALGNQPDYLKAQLNLDRTQLELLQAENNRLWDLSLNTSYGYASSNRSDVRVGLGFGYTFGDLTTERNFQRSRVNQLQAENTLQEQRKSLEIQVTDGIRDVRLSFAQVELARKATQLSERQLEIAREKQRLGLPISVFELVRLQNDLVVARNQELTAIINYLNALTRLDQTLGTTLDTWQVRIERT